MKFKTILIDPPWEYDDKLDDTRKKPYKTLTIYDLANLPIKKLADDDCHLFLWTTNSFLEEALKLLKCWSFKYICGITWLKRTNSGKLWFGMGHYFRICTEHCLFAHRGKLKLKTKNTRNIVDAKKPQNHHAAKPIEMYDLIEKNCYPPCLELFATSKRNGWTSLGYEINQKDIQDELQELINNL